MHRYCFLLLLLSFKVICDDCVVLNFENDFKDDFRPSFGVCSSWPMWSAGLYSTLQIEAPQKDSTTFITPERGVMTCMSSYEFTMTSRGRFEVNYYLDTTSTTDSITFIAFQSNQNGNDGTVATHTVTSGTAYRGWLNTTFTVSGTGQYNGYISIMGFISTSSVVLIDSIRYLSPSSVVELCPLYEQDIPTTVPTAPPTMPPTEAPTETPTEPPTAPPTEPPTEPPTQPPTEPPTEPPTDPPTEPPTELPTEPPRVVPTEPPTDPPTELPTEPPTQPLTEPPTELPTTLSEETSTPSITSTATPPIHNPAKRPRLFVIINKINETFVLNKL